MRYDVLLMDADMTIYDFHAAEREALQTVLDHLRITDPQAPEIYSRINARCWADLEKGLITQDELRVRRFRELLEYYEIEADLEEVPQLYVEALSQQAPLLPGAKEAVQELAAILPIAIVTNGIPYVQHGRFDRSELRPYIQELVISGEEGFFKPDPRLIEVALRRMNCSKERALMVGDSLGSDILGAQRAGVDSCWYNPAAKPCTLEKEPDYTIKDLQEIKKILNGEE
ncbi:MAG: YjjG family noncanonical pyrimidine nucleotidase [Clostridia bacterium]|nr:YjjG family noncanonical pyrimidine nucleotidase [Clostridia bacterium]